ARLAYGSEVGVSQIFASHVRLAAAGDHQQLVADLLLDLLTDFRIVFQVLGGIGLALADLVALVGIPGAGLLDQALLHAKVDDFAAAVDALAIENLELGLTERWRHLVLHDLDAGFTTDHFVAFLHRAGTTDIQTDRGVELECVTTGGG